MKIYTGFGDKGKTRLHGNKTVDKDHLRVETYGVFDELNAILGIIVSHKLNPDLHEIFNQIQNDIFFISSEIATPDSSKREILKRIINISDITRIEQKIDILNDKLPQLKNFILPGGEPVSAMIHLARTVCRRAERRLITLMRKEKIEENILVYVNRLSDLLFVIARFVNFEAEVKDRLWIGRKPGNE